MSYSLNKAQIIGNLTRDPESRTTTSGQNVTSFGVATNRAWTDQSGQKQERVEFHNIVIWGRLAEIAAQYLGKGRKVYIEGRLQTREWEGQDGVKRRTTEIVAENLILLDRPGGKSGSVDGTPYPTGGDSKPTGGANESNQPSAENEEEIQLENIPF